MVYLASNLITTTNGVEQSIWQAESELPDDNDVRVLMNGVVVVVSGDPWPSTGRTPGLSLSAMGKDDMADVTARASSLASTTGAGRLAHRVLLL